MEARSGRIKRGKIELDEPTDAPDGTRVTVLIREREEAVTASDEELAVIDRGLSQMASSSERIDAKEFLRALRNEH